MKATVVYDEHGDIIAISKTLDLKRAGSKFVKAGMIPGKGQRTLDVELTEEIAKMHLGDIHMRYRVDSVTSKLVKREHAITA